MSWPFEFLARRSWQVFLKVSCFCITTSFTKRRHFPSWALSFAVLANSKGFCWCRKEWQSCWAPGTSPGNSIIRQIILHMTNGFSWSAQFRYSFLGVLALTLRTEEAFVILVSVATDFFARCLPLGSKISQADWCKAGHVQGFWATAFGSSVSCVLHLRHAAKWLEGHSLGLTKAHSADFQKTRHTASLRELALKLCTTLSFGCTTRTGLLVASA